MTINIENVNKFTLYSYQIILTHTIIKYLKIFKI